MAGNVPPSKKEKIFGALNDIISGFSGQSSDQTPLGMAINKEAQQRSAQAQLKQQSVTQLAGVLTTGIDPNTGQPLTPDQRTQLTQLYEKEWADFAKLAGVNKETKGKAGKAKAFLDHIINMGKGKNQGQGNPAPAAQLGTSPADPAQGPPRPQGAPGLAPPPGLVSTVSPSPALQQQQADNEEIRKAKEMAPYKGASKTITYVGPNGEPLLGTESDGRFLDATGNPLPVGTQTWEKPSPQGSLQKGLLKDGRVVLVNMKTGKAYDPADNMQEVSNPEFQLPASYIPKETDAFTKSVDSDGNVTYSEKSNVTGLQGMTPPPGAKSATAPAAAGKPKGTSAAPAASATVPPGGKAREKEYQSTLATWRMKLSLLQQDVKSASTQNATHYILKPGGDVNVAKTQLANMQKAVDFLTQEQDDVRTGKASMADVEQIAQEIADGKS